MREIPTPDNPQHRKDHSRERTERMDRIRFLEDSKSYWENERTRVIGGAVARASLRPGTVALGKTTWPWRLDTIRERLRSLDRELAIEIEIGSSTHELSIDPLDRCLAGRTISTDRLMSTTTGYEYQPIQPIQDPKKSWKNPWRRKKSLSGTVSPQFSGTVLPQ
jgi:hypothetical protein